MYHTSAWSNILSSNPTTVDFFEATLGKAEPTLKDKLEIKPEASSIRWCVNGVTASNKIQIKNLQVIKQN